MSDQGKKPLVILGAHESAPTIYPATTIPTADFGSTHSAAPVVLGTPEKAKVLIPGQSGPNVTSIATPKIILGTLQTADLVQASIQNAAQTPASKMQSATPAARASARDQTNHPAKTARRTGESLTHAKREPQSSQLMTSKTSTTDLAHPSSIPSVFHGSSMQIVPVRTSTFPQSPLFTTTGGIYSTGDKPPDEISRARPLSAEPAPLTRMTAPLFRGNSLEIKPVLPQNTVPTPAVYSVPKIILGNPEIAVVALVSSKSASTVASNPTEPKVVHGAPEKAPVKSAGSTHQTVVIEAAVAMVLGSAEKASLIAPPLALQPIPRLPGKGHSQPKGTETSERLQKTYRSFQSSNGSHVAGPTHAQQTFAPLDVVIEDVVPEGAVSAGANFAVVYSLINTTNSALTAQVTTSTDEHPVIDTSRVLVKATTTVTRTISVSWDSPGQHKVTVSAAELLPGTHVVLDPDVGTRRVPNTGPPVADSATVNLLADQPPVATSFHRVPGIWQNLGPSSCRKFDTRRQSGRINSIAISPPDDSGRRAMYIAGVGGIWRSWDYADAEPTWEPLTDFLIDIDVSMKDGILDSICVLAFDPFHPGTLYAGGGTPGDAGDAPSQGILKSTDWGKSWRLLGQSTFASPLSVVTLFVDQTDPTGATIFAVGGRKDGRGIFVSTDGGETWTPLIGGLPIKEDNNQFIAVTDLTWQKNVDGGLVLFAAVLVRARALDGSPFIPLQSGIFQSDDRGQTWMSIPFLEIIDGSFATPATRADFGYTRMAVAGRNVGDPIYASITHRLDTSKPKFGITSPDPKHDADWIYQNAQRVLNVFKLRNVEVSPGQLITGWVSLFTPDDPYPTAHYDLAIDAITQGGYAQAITTGVEGAVFFAGNEPVYQSWDGGLSWSEMRKDNYSFGDALPHSDQHDLLYDSSSGRLYAANDGGIFVFDFWFAGTQLQPPPMPDPPYPDQRLPPIPAPSDQKPTWPIEDDRWIGAGAWSTLSTPSLLNMEQSSTTASPVNPDFMFGDGQDNGLSCRNFVTGDWLYVDGGDEYGGLRFSSDGKKLYWGRNRQYETLNVALGIDKKTPNAIDGSAFKSIEPAGIMTNGAPIFAVHPVDANTLMVAWPTPAESHDSGTTWQPLSFSIAPSGGIIDMIYGSPPGKNRNGSGAGIGFNAPIESAYIATPKEIFWRANNVGNFSRIIQLTIFAAEIQAITCDQLDPAVVFVATVDGNVFMTRHAYPTIATGSLVDITGNLAGVVIEKIAVYTDELKNTQTVVIGTSSGIWTNTMVGGVPAQWVRSPGFPDVRVKDMYIDQTAAVLVVATQGRSSWLMDL